jgi:hypothetical protein
VNVLLTIQLPESLHNIPSGLACSFRLLFVHKYVPTNKPTYRTGLLVVSSIFDCYHNNTTRCWIIKVLFTKGRKGMNMSKNFFVRNSLYVTLTLAGIVMIYTIINWNTMPMTQRIAGIYYFLIALHEIEEMKVPGGFVEMVIKLTGMPVKDMTIPHFCLFLITVYMMLIPFCLSSIHWLVIGPLVLGTIEPIAHFVVGKANPATKIYSPGMITAVIFMIPLDVYTFYYLFSVEPVSWYYWVAAALLLLIPLFGIQRYIVVHLMKMDYRQFVRNARDSITGKRKIQM